MTGTEFRTRYIESRKRRVASAYVLRPLRTSFVSIYERSRNSLKSRRERERLEREMSKSIFELTKIHEVLQFIYERMWRGPGMTELRYLINITAARWGAYGTSQIFNDRSETVAIRCRR